MILAGVLALLITNNKSAFLTTMAIKISWIGIPIHKQRNAKFFHNYLSVLAQEIKVWHLATNIAGEERMEVKANVDFALEQLKEILADSKTKQADVVIAGEKYLKKAENAEKAGFRPKHVKQLHRAETALEKAVRAREKAVESLEKATQRLQEEEKALVEATKSWEMAMNSWLSKKECFNLVMEQKDTNPFRLLEQAIKKLYVGLQKGDLSKVIIIKQD